jgi:alginate O-acetyltransferase complex protein AlgI
MLFNSLHFLFFLPVVIALYYLLPHRFRWMLLFAASCYFYMALVPAYILILFFIIFVDYSAALVIERLDGRLRKAFLVVSIIANVGLLAFFKYFNFANENLTWMMGVLGKHNPVGNLNIILPIGLSFHTFQSMAYTIEVYRGKQKAERHLGYFANYVLFFPQMVAGPIERYDRLGNQLQKVQVFLYDNFAKGFRLILLGFFAKMAIADNLATIVNEVYKDPAGHSSVHVAMAIVFFSFQIYADFYGYSLIAMGAAKMLGIDLMENFRTPYLGKNIDDFWKRWHISLTTWFRDYLYIPLGGNRVKLLRWCLNIMIVFVISGLWHGANWTFVIWGFLHGLLYLVERATNKVFKINTESGNVLFNFFRTIKTFVLVSFIWIFFRAESLQKVKEIIKAFLRNLHVKDELRIDPKIWGLLVVFIAFDLLLFNKRIDNWLSEKAIYVRWGVYAVLLFAVMAMGGVENVPFIYFQF